MIPAGPAPITVDLKFIYNISFLTSVRNWVVLSNIISHKSKFVMKYYDLIKKFN